MRNYYENGFYIKDKVIINKKLKLCENTRE